MQAYPLDAVIRKVGRDTKAVSLAERVVIIDVARGKAVEKKRLLSNAIYFLVANTSDGRKGAECKVPWIHLRDFGSDREIAIQVNYLAYCEPGNERKVAEALFHGPHPAAVLNEKIKTWLVDFVGRRQGDFIDNYFDQETQLQGYIRTKAYEEVGLTLLAKFWLQGQDGLNPVAIGPLNFSVRVKDYDENQSLAIRGELQVDEQSKINAILHRPSVATLEQLVEKEVRKYFAENVSLHKFCTELNKDGVKHGLIAHLNGVLKPKGRRIGYLSLEGSAQDSRVKPFFETNQNVECKIQEYPEPVIIKNTVQMILQDIAKYRANGSPDLKDWIEEKLVRVIHDLLFDAKYIDLLLNFQSRKERVKDILSAEAEAIGYNIKQLITVPDLEPFEWLKPFDIDVEENFETKLPKFKVKLGIVVTVRIKDLQGIEYHLNHRQNVPKLMKKAVLDDMRRLLHTLDPERFYMRFSFTDEPGETAVEEELIRRISKTLTKQFNAEVLTVIPKVGDTDMTERLRELQSTVCHFEFEFFSPDSPSLVPVPFVGSFKVESVDANGWHKFQMLKYDLADIKCYLEDNILAELERCRRAIEAGRQNITFDDVEDAIKHLAENCIKEVYGLSITVNAVRRKHTIIEIGEREVGLDRILKDHMGQMLGHSKRLKAGNERIDSLSQQVKKAEEVLLTIITEGGSNAEAAIEEQKKIIESLRGELESAHTPNPKALKKSLSSNSSGRAVLPDFSGSKRSALGEKPHDKNGKQLKE